MMPDVSAIFVHYGSLEHTERAVRELASFPVPTREIIVIDNASDHPFPADRYPRVRTLRLTENHGYGYACNRGAELARGRALFILNNDLQFPTDPLPVLLQQAGQSDRHRLDQYRLFLERLARLESITLLKDDEEAPARPADDRVNHEWCVGDGRQYLNCLIFRSFLADLLR